MCQRMKEKEKGGFASSAAVAADTRKSCYTFGAFVFLLTTAAIIIGGAVSPQLSAIFSSKRQLIIMREVDEEGIGTSAASVSPWAQFFAASSSDAVQVGLMKWR